MFAHPKTLRLGNKSVQLHLPTRLESTNPLAILVFLILATTWYFCRLSLDPADYQFPVDVPEEFLDGLPDGPGAT